MKVTASDLHSALAAVLPHADTDASLPALNGVHLAVTDGVLQLRATDRYTLGTCTVPSATELPDELAYTLPLADAKRWVALLKAERDAPVTLTVESDKITLETYSGSASATAPYGDFPNIAPLLANFTPADTAEVTLNGEYLARFAIAARALNPQDKTRRVTLTLGGPTKSAKITVGERFVGLIMPIRTDR